MEEIDLSDEGGLHVGLVKDPGMAGFHVITTVAIETRVVPVSENGAARIVIWVVLSCYGDQAGHRAPVVVVLKAVAVVLPARDPTPAVGGIFSC